MTGAHYQTLVLNETLRLWYPEHEPRENDPHYPLFHQVKKRLREMDVPCWRCDVHYAALCKRGDPPTETNPLGATQLEAHHADIEFSLANAVDVAKWWKASTRTDDGYVVESFSKVDNFLQKHPELKGKTPEEIFGVYIESEGNLMQLCDVCHRSRHQGIHHIPYPEWRALAVWKSELPAHIQRLQSINGDAHAS